MGTEYEVKDFEEQVIDGSEHKPVIVDFWADWCGPCHMLEPIITELAAENKNDWTLVKVNVDDNEEISDAYNIKSIPTLCIFDNGEVIARFNGLMYKRELKAWIDQNLPNDLLQKLNRIKELIDAGKPELSRPELESLVNEAPDKQEPRVLLACELALEDSDRAVSLVTDVHQDSAFYPYADSIRALHELFGLSATPERAEGKSGKEMLLAIDYIKNKQLAPALELLVDIVMHDREGMNEMARKACVAIFTILGHRHPITLEFRKRFDTALY